MSDTPVSALPPIRRRHWLWRLVAVFLLAGTGAGVAAWWYFHPREQVPQPPVVDLSHADPEVARVIQTASEKVRANPRDAAAWGKLGMLLLAHDFDTESQAAFRTAASLDPNEYRWPYLEGLTRVLFEPEVGLERLRHAAELAPAKRPEPRLRLAELLVERGDLDGAKAFAQAVLSTESVNSRAELILARVAAACGDWEAVLDWTGRCVVDPLCRRAATLLRGQAFEVRGEQKRADAEFRAAETLPEAPPWPDPIVAEVESLRVGTKAILAQAAELLGQGRAAEAAQLLETATTRSPNSPEPVLLLGQALIQAGNALTARKVLENYVVRFPSSVEGWFSLGVSRFQTDDVAGATNAFREVIKLKPDHARAHFNLGHCYRKAGDKAAAKAAYEESLRCRPGYQAARDALANLEAGKE